LSSQNSSRDSSNSASRVLRPEVLTAGRRRPVVVVQGDALNRSRISTVVCVPLTSNLRWADAPGNLSLPARTTGLPKDSVANVSRILSLDKDLFTERVGKLPRARMELLFSGIDIVLGR
jgi:mRNA interferase MazF